MFSMYKDKAYRLFRKTTLYIVRRDTKGCMQDSAPCKDCHATILDLNIKKIVYSSINDNIIVCKPCNYQTEHECQGKKHLKDITNKTRKKSRSR